MSPALILILYYCPQSSHSHTVNGDCINVSAGRNPVEGLGKYCHDHTLILQTRHGFHCCVAKGFKAALDAFPRIYLISDAMLIFLQM